MTEITLLKLTRPEVAADVPALHARIDTLERRVSAIARMAPGGSTDAGGKTATAKDAARPAKPSSAPPSAVGPDPAATEAAQPASVPTAEAEPGDTSTVSDEPAAGPVDMAAFKRIWPALSARVKDELGNRRHALFREARPGAVEGDVLVIHVPGHLGFHLEQMVSDPQFAVAVSTTASSLLGGAFTARFEADTAVDAKLETVDDGDDDEEVIDKDRMAEAEAADPLALLEDLLGGEVIDES